jgi:hypothetical protein
MDKPRLGHVVTSENARKVVTVKVCGSPKFCEVSLWQCKIESSHSKNEQLSPSPSTGPGTWKCNSKSNVNETKEIFLLLNVISFYSYSHQNSGLSSWPLLARSWKALLLSAERLSHLPLLCWYRYNSIRICSDCSNLIFWYLLLLYCYVLFRVILLYLHFAYGPSLYILLELSWTILPLCFSVPYFLSSSFGFVKNHKTGCY